MCAIGLAVLGTARQVLGEAPLDVQAVHQDPVTAALADQPDVGTEPDHLPVAAATRMLLAEAEPVADAEIERCCHRHSPPSPAVTPVKLNDPRWSAGTRCAPTNSPGSSLVLSLMARTSLNASGIACVKRKFMTGRDNRPFSIRKVPSLVMPVRIAFLG